MATENIEKMSFHMVHRKKRNTWRIHCKRNPKSKSPKCGITKCELQQTLNNWIPPNSYTNTEIFVPITIHDRVQEELWLRRCITDDEYIDNWNIIILYVENFNFKHWFKIYIKNKHTGLYSGRSVGTYNQKKINCFRKQSQSSNYMVEWNKFSAYEPFWVDLIQIMNPSL